MTCLKFVMLCGALLVACGAMAKPPLPAGAQAVFTLGYESAENLEPVRATMGTKPSARALKVDCSVARSGKCSVMASI